VIISAHPFAVIAVVKILHNINQRKCEQYFSEIFRYGVEGPALRYGLEGPALWYGLVGACFQVWF
jgi:hypothetical protein